MKILTKIKHFLFGRNVPAPAPAPTPVKAPRKRIKPKLVLDPVAHGGNRVGRANKISGLYAGEKLYLERLDTHYDDGYDKGGAYWGLPSPTTGRVWCAWAGPDDYDPDETMRVFVWALTRDAAKAAVREVVPTATFYR
jgi:hypothetical protein